MVPTGLEQNLENWEFDGPESQSAAQSAALPERAEIVAILRRGGDPDRQADRILAMLVERLSAGGLGDDG